MFFAVPIPYVREILPFLPIDPSPDQSSYVRGVTYVRGNSIPVLDAAEWLNLKRRSPSPEDPHIVVLLIQQHLVGLIVDEVVDLVDLPDSPLGPSEEVLLKVQFQDKVIQSTGTVYHLMQPEQSLHQHTVP